MNKLERIRKRTGIVFNKSFRCIEAEKNIHLVDKDKFFDKFVKRLREMNYEVSNDFIFENIRYKIPYSERHHIGSSYEWKYFYSTTFTIDDELIEFLLNHRFIFVIKTKQDKKSETINNEINKYKKIINRHKNKIEHLEKCIRVKKDSQKIQTEYNIAIKKLNNKIKNLNNMIKKLENNGEE